MISHSLRSRPLLLSSSKLYFLCLSSSKSLLDGESQGSPSSSSKIETFSVPKAELDLISKYKSIMGDLWISPKFIVPKKDPWPESAYGFPLGRTIATIRKRYAVKSLSPQSIKTLTRLGLPWKFRRYKNEDIALAFSTYKVLFDNVNVPTYFIVPSNVDWPECTWRMKLGFIAHNLRNKNYRTRLDDLTPLLDRLSFDFQPQITSYEHVKEALLHYQHLHGHMRIPTKYKIAVTDETYPVHLRGIPLGPITASIRHANQHEEHAEELQAIGFSYEHIRHKPDFLLLKSAFEAYSRIYGHLLVPANYIIPFKDTRFPIPVQGMKLGQTCNFIRNHQKLFAEHREELLAMGFVYEKQKNVYRKEFILEAMIHYQGLYGGLGTVPRVSFVIADTDTRFPAHLRGLPLGELVCLIRTRNYYKKYRNEWIALGIIADS